jgi:hypothetical protein
VVGLARTRNCIRVWLSVALKLAALLGTGASEPEITIEQIMQAEVGFCPFLWIFVIDFAAKKGRSLASAVPSTPGKTGRHQVPARGTSTRKWRGINLLITNNFRCLQCLHHRGRRRYITERQSSNLDKLITHFCHLSSVQTSILLLHTSASLPEMSCGKFIYERKADFFQYQIS